MPFTGVNTIKGLDPAGFLPASGTLLLTGARMVPVTVLVLFGCVTGILGLFFGARGRIYAQVVMVLTFGAACALLSAGLYARDRSAASGP